MKRSFTGSCHCGPVRFVADLDLARGTNRCNCSICRKSRFWRATVQVEDFLLTAGHEALVSYGFRSGASNIGSVANAGSRFSDAQSFPPPSAPSMQSTWPALMTPGKT